MGKKKKEEKKNVMEDKIVVFAVGLIAGFLIGIILPRVFSGNGEAPLPPPSISSQTINYQQTVDRLKGLLEQDPGNYQAWVNLGNAYYDSQKPAEAVEAYNKALEINPSDPNVHTDLGTMYRQLDQPESAVKHYQEARKLDARHTNSRLNLGIVLLHDMRDYKGAIEAWEEFLEVEPPGERAESIRARLASLRNMQDQEEALKKAVIEGGEGTQIPPFHPPLDQPEIPSREEENKP